jgi:hypothetical protein
MQARLQQVWHSSSSATLRINLEAGLLAVDRVRIEREPQAGSTARNVGAPSASCRKQPEAHGPHWLCRTMLKPVFCIQFALIREAYLR